MNKYLTIGLTSILLTATTVIAASAAQVEAIVRDYTSGGNVVVEAYRTFAISRADAAIASINAARTIPEVVSAANDGRTRLSVSRGEAADDKDRATLNSIADHLKVAKERLSGIQTNHSALAAPHARHLKDLKSSFERHRDRITRAENARKAALRARR